MARKRLIIGNWKMYIEDPEEAHAYALALRRKARTLTGTEVWLAPPALLLPDVAHVLESSPVRVGAQTVSAHNGGAHTGDVSAKTCKQCGALFALVGHSERRAAGDTQEVVRAQLERALEAGLAPVLCIGERERERDGEHFELLESQLTSALRGIPTQQLKKLVVAYEPVWAIGKHAESAMQPHELQEMVIFIRKVLADTLDRPRALKTPILYGGAVEAENAAVLMQEGGVNGLLVGHASAELEQFLEILKAVK
jgi:triosephosphate isomerase